MVRTLSKLPIERHLSAGKAVVEHHFDNHTYCGGFCKRKTLTEEQKKQSAKIYRSKVKDAKLYKFLNDTVCRFVTAEALREVGHGFDTQVNESLNNTVSWHAPKNKTYSGTMSLSNRISMAIGISTVGSLEYYRRLFTKCGIHVTEATLHYLTQHQKARAYRIETYKKKEVKKKRNTKLHDKLREYSEKVKKNVAKRDGTVYQPGIGMDGGYCQQEEEEAPAPAAANNNSIICSACGESGHKMRTNKKCRFYKPRGATAGATTKPVALPDNDSQDDSDSNKDAEEQELLDSLPFDDESDDEFFDAIEDDFDSTFLI